MRLIDADELKKAIEQGEGFSWDSHGKDDLCVRKKYIDNAPTVEIPTELCKGCRFLKDCETCEEKLRPQGEWFVGDVYPFKYFANAQIAAHSM